MAANEHQPFPWTTDNALPYAAPTWHFLDEKQYAYISGEATNWYGLFLSSAL